MKRKRTFELDRVLRVKLWHVHVGVAPHVCEVSAALPNLGGVASVVDVDRHARVDGSAQLVPEF